MNAFRLTLIVFLVPLVLSSGCNCRKTKKSPDIRFTEAGGVNADRELQKKKDFDGVLEKLDSLEDTPCLPETPGGEKLVQYADRLNKWIRNRQEDESWKPDAKLLEMENASRNVARTSSEIVRLLQLLQGNEDVTDDEGKPVTATESLQEERMKIVEQLAKIVGELTLLAEQCDITDVLAFSQQVEGLRKKFEALEKIPNLNAGGIRNFTRQLGTELTQFKNITDNFEKYASELRTKGLFVQYSDVEYMKQCVWLRDVSNWARGDRQALLERVVNLFDWTICNIDFRDKVVPMGRDQVMEMPLQYPWQSMLLGYSTLWDRTWVFIELLRQQRIDACLLSVPHPENPKLPLYWAVGVLLEGELYLFIPPSGMPLPGPGGAKIAEDGSLSFPEIATFSQVLKDDKLLRQLDVSEEQKYPITSELLSQSTAWLVAAPETASMRMKVLESELSGEQNMVLYTDLAEQRRCFGEMPSIAAIDIWKHPFRVKFEQMLLVSITNDLMALFMMPNLKRQDFPLWTGRILYFKGRIAGQDSAITRYQDTRISDRDIMEYRNDAAFRNNPVQARLLQVLTINATYWLGLASFEADKAGMTSSAKDFLDSIRTNSLSTWRAGTEYALGRIAEREKRYEDAVNHYGRTALSPSGPGNELRARWLQNAVGLTPGTPKPADGN